jgi:plasmid stability protein
MASLQIRDLPDEVYEALAIRAKSEHRSLAQQAIVELRRIPEILKDLKKRIETEPQRQFSRTPEEMIREDRER